MCSVADLVDRAPGRCSVRERWQASATSAVSSASATVQGEDRRPATTSTKAASSARNASAKRSMKNVCGGPAGKVAPGLDRPQRQPVLQPDRDAVRRAVQLQPHVVAAPVVAGVRHHREGAVVEREQGGRGVHVPDLAGRSPRRGCRRPRTPPPPPARSPSGRRRSRAPRSRGRCRRTPPRTRPAAAPDPAWWSGRCAASPAPRRPPRPGPRRTRRRTGGDSRPAPAPRRPTPGAAPPRWPRRCGPPASRRTPARPGPPPPGAAPGARPWPRR